MLRGLAEIYDRLVQKLVLIVFYYVPVAVAYLTPNFRDSDIRGEHSGSLSFDTGRHAVYVLWQPKTIPWYVLNMLGALKGHQVNTTVVSNETLSAEQLAILKPLCREILVRGNKGFDFGAYKDAILRLMKDKASVSRLLILNDSVYVFRRGLDQLIGALLSEDAPLVASHENWEKHYHFQSFCLGLSGEVLRDPQVAKFWRQYRPISIRRWCIDQGEVKLSLAIRKAASSFRVVYSINGLLDELSDNADWATLLQYKEFVPLQLRDSYPKDDVLSMLRTPDPAERLIVLRRLKERLSALFMRRAQSHTAAFFFPKFLETPMLKRDIVYRELFTVYEVERMLRELAYTGELQSITDDIRKRGTAKHLRGLAKRRYRLGLR